MVVEVEVEVTVVTVTVVLVVFGFQWFPGNAFCGLITSIWGGGQTGVSPPRG